MTERTFNEQFDGLKKLMAKHPGIAAAFSGLMPAFCVRALNESMERLGKSSGDAVKSILEFHHSINSMPNPPRRRVGHEDRAPRGQREYY